MTKNEGGKGIIPVYNQLLELQNLNLAEDQYQEAIGLQTKCHHFLYILNPSLRLYRMKHQYLQFTPVPKTEKQLLKISKTNMLLILTNLSPKQKKKISELRNPLKNWLNTNSCFP